MSLKDKRSLSSLEFMFVGPAEDDFTGAIQRHMALHEGVGLSDLLKFLYQSAMGSFHLLGMMTDRELLEWIRRSLENTEPSGGPLVEELYSKTWVRLNFGPFKRKYGNDYPMVFEAFMNARDQKPGRLEDFEKLVEKLANVFRQGLIQPVAHEPKALPLVESFLKEYREQGCPPIHHSKSYILKNNSDYLVVPSAIEWSNAS